MSITPPFSRPASVTATRSVRFGFDAQLQWIACLTPSHSIAGEKKNRVIRVHRTACLLLEYRSGRAPSQKRGKCQPKFSTWRACARPTCREWQHRAQDGIHQFTHQGAASRYKASSRSAGTAPADRIGRRARAAAENSLNAAAFIKCIAKQRDPSEIAHRDRSLNRWAFHSPDRSQRARVAQRTSEAFGILFSSIRFFGLRDPLPARQVPSPRMQSILSQHQRDPPLQQPLREFTIMPDALFAFISERELEYILRRVRVEVAGRLVGEAPASDSAQCRAMATRCNSPPSWRKNNLPCAQTTSSSICQCVPSCVQGRRSAAEAVRYWLSEMRQDVECLKDKSNSRGAPVATSSLNDETAADQYLPRIRNIQTSNQIQQGRFANAGLPMIATYSPARRV